MTNPDQNESELLAIQAELASPLVHESNNFLNNLFMHMALFQEHLPAQLRTDCDCVRQEGKKLARLLRQWQSNRRVSLDKAGRIDLNQMIEEAVERLRPENGPRKFTLALSPEPLWLYGPMGKLKRFCHLWLQNALELKEAGNGKCDGALVVQTGTRQDKVYLQIQNVGSELAPDSWPDVEDEGCAAESLTLAACKSMARHLHGKIRVEQGSHGKCDLVVEFYQDSACPAEK